jgi:hypothetical protein
VQVIGARVYERALPRVRAVRVTISDPTRRILVFRLAYENLGAAGQGWDYLTEENDEASIGLLGELASEVVRLRNRVLEAL